MSRRDLFHDIVRQALEKDGWTITHDPFFLEIGNKRLAADLGAERVIAASRGIDRIIVEVKSFIGASSVVDLEKSLGQYILYQRIMEFQAIDHRLYLAIPKLAYEEIFTIPLGTILLQTNTLRLVVFDPDRSVILQWIPN